jgi:protein phosphatase
VLKAYGLTDRGRVRPVNEDCFAIDESLGLCVIADGMGGHNAGAIAAQLAVDAVVDAVRSAPPCTATQRDDAPTDTDAWPFGYDPSLTDSGNLLRTAIHAASLQVIEAAFAETGYAGMGTTIVAARAVDGWLSVAHAGDSRLYLLAAGHLRQVTEDDSWVATMLAREPGFSRALLRHHPLRNILTNAVGTKARTTVHEMEQRLTGGEMLLLSTDGVHGVLEDERLERLLLEDTNPRRVAERVVSAALTRGSCDNCTAVVAAYSM